MCRSCLGKFPSQTDHRALSDAAATLRNRVVVERLKAEDNSFLEAITALDGKRFGQRANDASPEWGQPQTAQATAKYIFRADPSRALMLFVLTCWYDAQEQYVIVWSRRLAQLDVWLASDERSEASLPSAKSGPWTRSIAWKTWQHCERDGFPGWFARTVNEIADANTGRSGNTYRFIGLLARELTNPGQATRGAFAALERGMFSPAMFKRAWMLMMFLRRDQGIIRCLVERSLADVRGGKAAAERWYSDQIFPQFESELPVDKRMLTIGRELFASHGMDESAVMGHAHSWGQAHGLPPSTLDALFFAID